jgi:SnoaL-like polyketide cyclase
MFRSKIARSIAVTVAIATIAAGVLATADHKTVADAEATTPSASQTAAARKQLQRFIRDRRNVRQNLKTFDTLDFDVFTNQQWDRLKESHAPNIRVYWPDGHMTRGLERHTEDLKQLFVYAPDTRVTEHPIKLGSGNLTAVTGVYEGTFTRPMPDGNGGFIQPTGKPFKLPIATIGIWKNGVMVEEHLFWDNQTFARQVGLTQ